jgi:hypothetical protein
MLLANVQASVSGVRLTNKPHSAISPAKTGENRLKNYQNKPIYDIFGRCWLK